MEEGELFFSILTHFQFFLYWQNFHHSAWLTKAIETFNPNENMKRFQFFFSMLKDSKFFTYVTGNLCISVVHYFRHKMPFCGLLFVFVFVLHFGSIWRCCWMELAERECFEQKCVNSTAAFVTELKHMWLLHMTITRSQSFWKWTILRTLELFRTF